VAPAVDRVEQRPGLRHGDHADEESLALADVQFNRLPARGLMLGEVLERIAPGPRYVIHKRDIVGGTGTDRLGIAATIVRLPRMAACGRLVPAKHLIIVFGVAAAHFRIVLGAPDVSLYAEVLLPKLIDQACEGPQQAFFHCGSQGAKALRMGLVFLEDGRQPRIPLAQRLLLRIRHVAKVVFRHPWHGVRGRQRIQQHPGVVGDHAVELVGEIGPQVRIAGKSDLIEMPAR